MINQSITDFDLQALVDNELEWEEAKRIRQHLDNNPEALKRYNELCRQKGVLRLWWKSSSSVN